MSIAIVGCGISGLLTAYELLDKGHQVALYDMQACGQESSWAGGGILSPLYPWRYADAVTELARWSQERYEGVCEQLKRETGIDPEWTRSGLLMLDVGAEECEEAQRWAERFGYALNVVGPAEVAALQPELGLRPTSSVWMPEVAQVRNPRFLKALKAFVVQNGATLHEHVPVTELMLEDQHIVGIRCGDRPAESRQVVICSGAWSARILEPLGMDVPISPVKGQMLLYRAPKGLLQHMVMHDGFYLIPRRDGRILAGSTLEHVGFDKVTTESARELLHAKATGILPELEKCTIELHWAGLRPGTNEGIPYIGSMPGYEGLYINAGQYRNGVVTGLASARLAAEAVLGQEPSLDPHPYKPGQG